MTVLESKLIFIYKKVSSFLKKYFRNKYWTAFIVFIIWVSFFDNNSLIRQVQRKYQIVKLNKEINYYRKELEKTKQEEKALKYSDEYFEKFVRETYLLKKPDEVLYIFSESKN
ncbi:MAG: FtsB family cell division protein [Chitinophagales bacterium]|jgi:cell division protein DivIC|nr:septum formation initiator family protein [Sphingobacteriales bacterium]